MGIISFQSLLFTIVFTTINIDKNLWKFNIKTDLNMFNTFLSIIKLLVV